MDVHLDVPEEVARQFAAEPGGITRVAIEALAMEGVRSGKLTVRQAREMLGIRSRYEMDGFLKAHEVDEAHMSKARALQEMARERGQSLAQMALAWVLRDGVIASVLIGASSVAQVEQNVAALGKLEFSAEELAKIDGILG